MLWHAEKFIDYSFYINIHLWQFSLAINRLSTCVWIMRYLKINPHEEVTWWKWIFFLWNEESFWRSLILVFFYDYYNTRPWSLLHEFTSILYSINKKSLITQNLAIIFSHSHKPTRAIISIQKRLVAC